MNYTNTVEYNPKDIGMLRFDTSVEYFLISDALNKYKNLFEWYPAPVGSDDYDFEVGLGVSIDLIKSICTKDMSKSEMIKFNMDFQDLINTNEETINDYLGIGFDSAKNNLFFVLMLYRQIDSTGNLNLSLYSWNQYLTFFHEMEPLDIGTCGIDLDGKIDNQLLLTKSQLNKLKTYIESGFDFFAEAFTKNQSLVKEYFIEGIRQFKEFA